MRSVERVWRRLFQREDLLFQPARVVHFDDGGDPEPCAPLDESLLGLYCPERRTIFLTDREEAGSFALWRYVVAHEVAHHVQELRGTLLASGEEFEKHTSFVRDLHLREELQADCYAGVWAHAVGAEPPDRAFHEQPDEEPGTPRQRRRWLMRGLRTGRPAECNTFRPRRP